MISGSVPVETKILTIIRSVSTGLIATGAAVAVSYPQWHWVPIATGILSLINLNFIPAATAALSPSPAVQVQLTPKDPPDSRI